MSAVALQLDAVSLGNTKASPRAKLRAACHEFVGMALFGQVLRQARQSCLNSKLMHSSGEKIFQQQLDDVLLQRSSQSLGNSLGESMYRQLSRWMGPEGAAKVR